MELSSLSENIVVVPFVHGGETAELSVNIDAFTPDFFRETGKRFDEKLKGLQSKKAGKARASSDKIGMFEDEARALELTREVCADLLTSGVLKAWTITENEMPVAPTKEVLMKLPPRVVNELWELCKAAANTVKKREDGEDEETLGSTHSGSRVALALAPTG